jgi:hypothetical protein
MEIAWKTPVAMRSQPTCWRGNRTRINTATVAVATCNSPTAAVAASPRENRFGSGGAPLMTRIASAATVTPIVSSHPAIARRRTTPSVAAGRFT